MRTDPRAACANTHERLGWAVLHDLIAHPLMALTGWSASSNIYTFRHPAVDRTFVTSAPTREIAQARADVWFAELAAEFGGAFARKAAS